VLPRLPSRSYSGQGLRGQAAGSSGTRTRGPVMLSCTPVSAANPCSKLPLGGFWDHHAIPVSMRRIDSVGGGPHLSQLAQIPSASTR
jgi:hypothetical protein